MTPDRQAIIEIKRALSDPTRTLEALGLMGEGRARTRQGAGWMIRCPVHEDRGPSCSVQRRHGILLWNCKACDARGDVLHLVALTHGLKLEADFRQVLVAAARLAGLWQLVDALERGAPPEAQAAALPVVRRPEPLPEPERTWPDAAEVAALWAVCTPTAADDAVSVMLRERALDPEIVDARDLGRVLPAQGALPSWASYRGDAPVARSWREVGYRLVVPMVDVEGALRSVRAWRVGPGEGPRRLPPSGCKASDLVMADEFGVAMLRGTREPSRVVVVEGEPDFFTRATVGQDPRRATIGIVSGSWSDALAAKFPLGGHVVVRTDHDKAGHRYAAAITRSLARRCFVYRSAP